MIRFYAGHPVDSGAGPLGGLCVADSRSRTLSNEQRAALADLARIVGEHVHARAAGLAEASATALSG
jgi:GAF domain-containing protein